MPAPERNEIAELLERADAVAARYDAARVLADCPCSGCNATRVLADVETQLRREIRMAINRVQTTRFMCGTATNNDDYAFSRDSETKALNWLRSVLRVRRAARGGRDGGGE